MEFLNKIYQKNSGAEQPAGAESGDGKSAIGVGAVPGDGFRHARRKVERGPEAGRHDLVGRRHRMLHVAGAFRLMEDFGTGAGQTDDLLREVVDGDPAAVSHVVDAGELMGRHEHVGCNDILDVDEVTGLFPVAEDGERFVGQRLRQKDRHRRRVGALRVLPGAEDVEIPQTGGLDCNRC